METGSPPNRSELSRRRVAAAGLALAVLVLVGCQPRSPREKAIVEAVRHNQADKVQAYLDKGGDPDATDAHGNPLLYIASGPRGGRDVVRVLLAGGADPRATSGRGRTVLQNAAGWCEAEIVSALIAAGADPHRSGKDGKTALDGVCAAPKSRRAATLEALGQGASGGN